ncbi:glycosyltransferase family 1 protein [Echinicola strongylocentroti]|uniref:Glycosyltransferase family 1 protein n=1 Tax=Echinicola strongylocentroti TaxID=1795355 RepID=A0A2Z4IND5_9BACT|nr:glycosyltransferase family 1 protein [Echinicola strongylocentroti]AWW32240.1 glycosyltransferase family 1 protein [Echinicola strongylocentroti]
MRIGFDAKRAFKNFTGLGNYSRFVLKSLSDNFPSNNYYLFTPVRGHKSEEVSIACKNPNQEIVLPGDMWKLPVLSSAWRSVFQGVKHFDNQLEIFHGLSNEIPYIKNKDTKYVVTVHDLLFCRYPEMFNPIDVQIYKMKMQRSCKDADQVIAISQQTKADLINFLGIEEYKIRVVYQGFHENYKRDISENEIKRVKTKYSLPDRFLFFVSTIERRKNVQLVLKAMKSRPDWNMPLVVVGRATSYIHNLRAMVEEYGLQDKVLFLHEVSFEDLPAMYKMAHVFIYPSYFEGFGIPIIEAQSMGTPVITTTGSCFHEAGGDAALYGDPDCPDTLVSHIEKMSKEDVRAEYISKGYQNIKRFDESVISNDLMDIYKEVLEACSTEPVLAT